jgi:CHAD domain-containing protein
MAKAQPIGGLECDAPAAAGSSVVLQARFDEILTFHSAAMDPDGIDGVHDMRVASRRFRSALRDFAPLFEKKVAKPLKKRTKVVADALGDVRDHDVAIGALTSLLERSPNDDIAAGIDRLIEVRRARRAESHAHLIERVSVENLGSLRGHLDQALDSTSSEKFASVTFRSFAAHAVERAHKKFLKRAERIFDPFDDKALHKLRLSAKRVRYALELFDGCWAGELKPFAKYVSKLQSSLGEVHDSSEWIGYLGQNLENNDIDRETAPWLISEFVSLRTAEYLKALQIWDEWLTSDLGGRLRAIMTK